LVAAVVALGAVFFGTTVMAFDPVALVAVLAVAVHFFLPITLEVSWGF
jgi:hypothetical protein